ncbi:HTH_Tnp_Tc3_2 domain-containing protein [Trichonephila clavipes]|nr:HTH_Tnp_Tc3_2 domain-containing protein [Trichonephila clavipes]
MQTVYRRLGYFGLYARRPVRCVQLTATHCRLQLTWSREHALWTPQQWSYVTFYDESGFSLQSDSRWNLIWRAPGTRYHQENTIERHRYGGAGWLARQSPPTCLPELRRALLDEWCNIPQDQIDPVPVLPPRREVMFLELFGTGNSVFLLAAAFASLFAVHQPASRLFLL